MTTTSSGPVVTPIASARFCLMFADLLLKGVSPEQFRRKPAGVNCNSAVFNYGHLTLYPDMVIELLGRDDLLDPDERFTRLFSRDVPCVDDPDGKIYPPMDEIVGRFRTRYEVALEALESADESVLSEPNPRERNRDHLPTKRDAITFYLTGHMMMHLGQVSTWRRCMGLGQCF